MINYSNLKALKVGSTWPWHITVKWLVWPILRKTETICNEKMLCDGKKMNLIFRFSREKTAQKHVPIARKHPGRKKMSTGVVYYLFKIY